MFSSRSRIRRYRVDRRRSCADRGPGGRRSASVTPAWATTVTVTVNGVSAWTDTGIALTAGESVSISASGTINIGNSSVANGGIETPDGAACSELGSELLSFPLPSAPCWSLIGRDRYRPGVLCRVEHFTLLVGAAESCSWVRTTTTSATTPGAGLPTSRRIRTWRFRRGLRFRSPVFSPIGATVELHGSDRE